jgi:hypothetical protein
MSAAISGNDRGQMPRISLRSSGLRDNDRSQPFPTAKHRVAEARYCERSDAIHRATARMDCFVAFAPRNDSTRNSPTPRSRGALLSRSSSLRTQGPITTGLHCLKQHRNEHLIQSSSSRRMGPCVRRDDADIHLYILAALYFSLAPLAGRGRGEGESPRIRTRRWSPSPEACGFDLSPQAGRGENTHLWVAPAISTHLRDLAALVARVLRVMQRI